MFHHSEIKQFARKKIVGTDGKDTLAGTSGKDVISGGGGDGDDEIVIEDGRDGDFIVEGVVDGELKVAVDGAVLDLSDVERITIHGGGGQSAMTGGTDADLFVFFALSDSPERMDIITAFHAFEGDRISLSTVDANKAVADDQAFTYLGEGAFDDGGWGELRVEYDANGVTLFADVNGDEQEDFTLRLAGLDEAHPLVAADFVL